MYHRSNKNAWSNQLLFQDTLLNCYVREIKWRSTAWRITYLARFCLLLIMLTDIYLPLIDDLYIKVLFLPPNTIALIWTMNQRVIEAFKAYHLRRTFAQDIAATEKDNDAIQKGLPHLWLRQKSCLGLEWLHQGAYQWHLEEDTQKVQTLLSVCQR